MVSLALKARQSLVEIQEQIKELEDTLIEIEEMGERYSYKD